MRAFMRRAITKNESQISSSEPTWTCVKCVLVNEASATTCRKCNSSQPSHLNKDNQDPPFKLSLQNIVAEKPCPTCTVLNPVNKSFCVVCESPLLTEMTTKKINKISANGDSGKENDIVDESHKCDSNVILEPDNHVERKYRTVYGNETSGMHIPKKANLFETLSSIQKIHDQKLEELESKEIPAPKIRALGGQSLSTLAAMRQNSRSAIQHTISQSSSFSQPISMSARKLKEQNGLLTSIATENSAQAGQPGNRLAHSSLLQTSSRKLSGTSENYSPSNAGIKHSIATIAMPSSQFFPPNKGEVIDLDTEYEDCDFHTEIQTVRASNTINHRDKSIDETIPCSKPRAFASASSMLKRTKQNCDLLEQESIRSIDESSAGSLEDFIVDDDDDDSDEETEDEDSDYESESNSISFLNSNDESEVGALYRSNREEIVLSEDDIDDHPYAATHATKRSRHNLQEDIIIDSDFEDNSTSKRKNQRSGDEPVFDLTAGFVHHTRNDLAVNPSRSEYREPPATFPQFAPHYWSVKQLFKEGCCAIDFNLFTLDAGATNPNGIGNGKAFRNSSKVPLSLEESYAQRKAARKAKGERKKRASVAKSARRKGGKQNKGSTKEPSVYDNSDKEANNSKKAYSKFRKFRKRK